MNFVNDSLFQEADEEVLKHLTDIKLIFTGKKSSQESSEDDQMVIVLLLSIFF